MSTIPIEHLERVYEALALAIDRAGVEREALFLAKVVLLLANEVGDGKRVEHCLEAALRDLRAEEG